MKKHWMSPCSHIHIKSGKPTFSKPVHMRTQNNWETFRHTKSVNSHTVLKDVQYVKKEKDLGELVTVKVEMYMGTFVRQVYSNQKHTMCYGVKCTLRSDGVFREIGSDRKVNPKSKKAPKTKMVKKEKLDGEIKMVIIDSKTYRIVRKGKK